MTNLRFHLASTAFLFLLLSWGGVACNLDDQGPTGIATDVDGGEPDQGAEVDAGPSSDATPPEDTGTDASTPATEGYVVFDDAVRDGVGFLPFGDSTNDVSVTTDEARSGTSSLRIVAPAGGYTGGAYVGESPADLTRYNALRMWIKASKVATLNVVGFGNLTTSNTREVELENISVSTEWTEVIIPLPDPAKSEANRGLFHFAEGSDEGSYELYIDDISYVALDEGTITDIQGRVGTRSLAMIIGQTINTAGFSFTATQDGSTSTYDVSGFYFDWSSSAADIVEVNGGGSLTSQSVGRATVSAELGGQPADGEFTIEVVEGPETAAPTPAAAVSQVVASVYSDAYNNVEVDTYLAPFSIAGLTLILAGGDEVLFYSSLDYAVIEFKGMNSLDLSDANFLHLDIWTNNASLVGVKLVDFGADNAFGGRDDSEAQIDLFWPDDFRQGGWTPIDLSLTQFKNFGMENFSNVSQLILVGKVDDGGSSVPGRAALFVDNIYFYRN